MTLFDRVQSGTREGEVCLCSTDAGAYRCEDVVGLFNIENQILDRLVESEIRRD